MVINGLINGLPAKPCMVQSPSLAVVGTFMAAVLLCLSLAATGAGATDKNNKHAAATQPKPIMQRAEQQAAQTTDKKPRQDLEKKKLQYKLSLLLLLAMLAILFGLFLLISVIRIWRFQRRRLQIGKKSSPTDYVDAWSKHKLPNDIDKD